MKTSTPSLIALVFVIVLSAGCSVTQEQETEKTVAEKIAEAYGIDNFYKLTQLNYRFNVQRDTIYFGRSWQWRPQSGEVLAIKGKDTIRYNQHRVEEESAKKTDQSFINDKYWLLFPFQMVWDTDVSWEQKEDKAGPISGSTYRHVVVTYTKDGGYTPGDVYELFLDDDWIIREWIFRRGGTIDPTIVTTWEGYQNFNGVKIATNHLNADGSFRLWFSEISVE
jgi:signal peptidase I